MDAVRCFAFDPTAGPCGPGRTNLVITYQDEKQHLTYELDVVKAHKWGFWRTCVTLVLAGIFHLCSTISCVIFENRYPGIRFLICFSSNLYFVYVCITIWSVLFFFLFVFSNWVEWKRIFYYFSCNIFAFLMSLNLQTAYSDLCSSKFEILTERVTEQRLLTRIPSNTFLSINIQAFCSKSTTVTIKYTF